MATGDILWVKATVAANTVGTTSSTNATAFADPYGIQAAVDAVLSGAVIKILKDDTNQYDDNSTSWTGRDAADGMININTTAGTHDAPITIQGMASETVEGEAILDFAKATVTGLDGFRFTTVDAYIVKNITIRDCDNDGFSFYTSSDRHAMFYCKAHDCAGDGFYCDGSYLTNWFFCEFYNNTGSGGEAGNLSDYFCEYHDNTGSGSSLPNGGSRYSHIFNVYDGNTAAGATHIASDRHIYFGCLFEDNGTDGYTTAANSEGQVFISCGFTNNTAWGVDISTSDQIWFMTNCGFNGNATGTISQPTDVRIKQQEVTTSPGFTDASTRDYSIGPNWKGIGFPYDGSISVSPASGNFSMFFDIGPAQRRESAKAVITRL